MASVFHDLVKKAIVANRAKHGPLNSPHEGLALIEEEVAELADEVRGRKRKKDPLRFLNELVEIAAFAERFAEEIVVAGDRGEEPSAAEEEPAATGPFADGVGGVLRDGEG